MSVSGLEPSRLLAVALVGAAVVGVAVPLVLGLPNLSILGLYVAVPMIAAPLVARGVRTGTETGGWSAPVRIDWRLPSTLFHLAVGALVVVLVATDVRPYAFYAGVTVLYLLAFLLIATTPQGRASRAIALYHLAATVLLVIYSVTLNYGFFVGHTDLTAHISMTTAIVETGRTSMLLPGYEAFQLWHVYAAFASLVFGNWIAPHTAMYLLSGGVFAAGVGLTFGLARRLYPDEKYALLASLVAISFPLYLFYGMYSIPRSVASIFFLALLLALVSRPTPGVRLLTVGLVAAIVVIHPVTIPFVLAILVLVALAERVLTRAEPIVDAYVFAVSFLFMSLYWLYAAEFLVVRLVGTIYAVLFEPTESAVPEGVIASPWTEVANYVPYGFALFFLLLGVLFLLQRRRTPGTADTDGAVVADGGEDPGADTGRFHPRRTATVGIVAVALVPLVFPGPLLLFDALAGVNVDRFGHYGFMFVALAGGYGLYELVRRGGLATLLALLLILSLFSFTAVSNDFTASDNPVVERPFYTFYLADDERQSFAAIDDGYRGEVGTDRISCRYMGEIHGSTCSVIDVGAGDAMFDDYDAVLLREGELEDRPLQFSAYVDEADLPREGLEDRDRVYDSSSVALHA
ncbi:hypothetical protein QA600_21040 [Natronococcus sp. A-GB1]|uniref:hypothetical protein n=1 Tax=Natronococcus sp. A-GB1 TaxID=3037648 RepID=UPI00241C6A4A|nr:hypothetical protein [Natronococcus sp. A-GB1]MDG5761812.1 hypothetical protein [Natronococcus sp. A-GB1]